MLVLQLQQPDLLGDGLLRIEIRAIQNGFDLLQRELQLPEQQNHLQPTKGFLVIQPIARLVEFGGLQQADGVIVAQGAGADAGMFADFMNCSHGFHFLPCDSIINHDAASESIGFLKKILISEFLKMELIQREDAVIMSLLCKS